MAAGIPDMATTAKGALKRKLVYLAILVLLFLGSAFGLGLAFLQGTG